MQYRPPTRALSRQDEPLIIAPRATRAFAERVAIRLGLELAELSEVQHEGGEYKTFPLTDVSGRETYIFQSLYGDPRQSVHDKLCEMLFLIGAVKDAGCAHLTAVVPYLCYGRKDRRTEAQEPVTTRYIASMFEALGVDEVITFDVHNRAAFENGLRRVARDIEALPLFVEHFSRQLQGREIAVVSPDIGGLKRAEAFRQGLSEAVDKEITQAFMVKYRHDSVVTTDTLVGDLSGRVAVIIDDMISTGTTIARAVAACAAKGADEIHVAATHGLFAEGVSARLDDPALTRLVITNTCDPFRLRGTRLWEKLSVLDVSTQIAALIHSREFGAAESAEAAPV